MQRKPHICVAVLDCFNPLKRRVAQRLPKWLLLRVMRRQQFAKMQSETTSFIPSIAHTE